jgi:hypothetical protein
MRGQASQSRCDGLLNLVSVVHKPQETASRCRNDDKLPGGGLARNTLQNCSSRELSVLPLETRAWRSAVACLVEMELGNCYRRTTGVILDRPRPGIGLYRKS